MSKRYIHFMVIVLALVSVNGVLASNGVVSPVLPHTQENAAPEILIDTDWLLENLDNEDVRLVDVSSNIDVYNEGHLPGAVYVDWRTDLTTPDNPVSGQIAEGEAVAALLGSLGIANDDTVVLYDDTRNLFAARAYWVLKYYQHEDVLLYNGGSTKWVADGQDLVSAVPEVEAIPYEVGEADPEIRTTGEYVLEHLDDAGVQYCDTRSPDEYIGTDVRAERGGHIPGAINLEWRHAVNDDGTFKDVDELAKLFEAAGFERDKQIITYCQTGVRGAHTWFVLRELLAYPDVRNYDGSWQEYGNDAQYPVES